MLKIGALVGIPAIMTLTPGRARASGSWKSMHPSKARAEGSWRGGPLSRVVDRHVDDFDQQMMEGAGNSGASENAGDGFVVPGSYRWRLLREAEKEERDRLRGDFSQFGGDE
jgi:hypothetical protein